MQARHEASSALVNLAPLHIDMGAWGHRVTCLVGYLQRCGLFGMRRWDGELYLSLGEKYPLFFHHLSTLCPAEYPQVLYPSTPIGFPFLPPIYPR